MQSAPNNGNISLTGNSLGGGPSSHGINITSTLTAAGTGTITMNGTGSVNNSGHGIAITGGGAVSTTGTGNLSGTGVGGGGGGYGIFVSGAAALIQTTGGSISLIGTGAGTGASAEGIGIFAASRVNATGSGGITLNGTASAIGGNNSRGIVINGAASAVTTNSGNIMLNGTGNGTGSGSSGLEVSSGGKINSTSGSISGTCLGGAGTSGCNGILVSGAGSLITTATGAGIDLTGTGRGILNNNRGIFLTTAGSITTTNNAPITLMGTGSAAGTSSNEGIFSTGVSTAASTVTGGIQMTGVAGGGTTNGISMDTSAAVACSTSGNITMNSPTGNIAIQNSSVQTFGSDLTMTASGSLNLVGATITTPAPTGNLLLIAGVDIIIDGTSQISALGTAASSLTFVVDNNFPTAPNIGSGQFVLSAGGIVSAGTGTPVRIYTARRSQNTISNSINGLAFSPGTLGSDSSTELWGIYYPGGGYGGLAFNLYYKEPPILTLTEQRTFFTLGAANLVELPYLLPVLDIVRKRYHFRVCDWKGNQLRCDPTFSPYGSFIFEDDVYWIGPYFYNEEPFRAITS